MKKVKFSCPEEPKKKSQPKLKKLKTVKETSISKKVAKRLDRGIAEMSSQIQWYDNMENQMIFANQQFINRVTPLITLSKPPKAKPVPQIRVPTFINRQTLKDNLRSLSPRKSKVVLNPSMQYRDAKLELLERSPT